METRSSLPTVYDSVHGSSRTNSKAEKVFSELYRAHRQLVYRIALRYGDGSTAWADDITQEVFVELAKSIRSLDLSHGIEGWLYRVTTYRCFNRLRVERFRRSAPVRWLIAEQMQPPVQPDTVVQAREELCAVQAAVATLPPKERVALCMHHLDGMTQAEIGQLLGHSKGYVSKLISRAEQKLNKARARREAP